jgi:hypothetical protein
MPGLVHVDPEVEQAEVAAGIVPHKDTLVDLVGVGHDIGHVAVLIGDQGVEGDVFAGLLGADERTARKCGSDLEGKSRCSPDRDEIRLQGGVCLLFVPAAAFAGKCQADYCNEGSTDQELPHQFPQFYGTQI